MEQEKKRLREKSRRLVMENLKTLQEDPFPGSGSNKERLQVHEDAYRPHISHIFTAFYRIHEAEKDVYVLAVLSIEQADRKYGWF